MCEGIHSTPSVMVRLVNSGDLENAPPSVLHRVALNVTFLIFSQPLKVLPYSITRSRGMFRVVMLVQFVNAPFPNILKVRGRLSTEIDEQPSKAFTPISTTSPNDTSTKAVQLKNA